MLIDPDRIPHLPVPFMNEDHAEEGRLINAAAEKVEAFRKGKVGAEAVRAALEALYAHTWAHFSREEAAMLEASFPAHTFHQAEHVRILGELGEAERRFKESGEAEPVAEYLAGFPRWFEQHINSMDAVTARYVAEWGR
ncbi:MAG TPA: hemerythrin family protein [Anaeromyxobacter sp.]|nr:hemerythrin family protein [Anaeromyxobacter sp.]